MNGFILYYIVEPTLTIQSDKYLRFNESNHAEIPCIAHGYPLPEIEWKSNTNQVLNTFKNETSNILIFNAIRRIDTGEYSCQIKNNANLSERIEIVVQCNYKNSLKLLSLDFSPFYFSYSNETTSFER